jgi:hypothetical protein
LTRFRAPAYDRGFNVREECDDSLRGARRRRFRGRRRGGGREERPEAQWLDHGPGPRHPGRGESDIPIGHKLAIKPLASGATVIKYGVDIGKTIAAIQVGEHTHVQNLRTKRW